MRRIPGDNCIAAVHHIGSMAVPGLAAKPIIDILPVVHDLMLVDEAAREFWDMGYEYMGEFGTSGRRYLRRGGDERTHQIHIFGEAARMFGRHLAVRDYQRAHARADYAALKKELARRYPYDVERYCLGKEEFLERLEEAAVAFRYGVR